MKKYILSLFLLVIGAAQVNSQTRVYTPELLAPYNETEGIITNLKLSWKGITGESSKLVTYSVQLAKDKDFTSGLIEGKDLDRTSFLIENLSPLTQYFWRVQANDNGKISPWSEAYSFTTFEKFELKSPTNDKKIHVKQLFVWKNPCPKSKTGVDFGFFKHIQLQFASDDQFTNIIHDVEVEPEKTSIEVTNLLYESKYFWRVRGINPNGSATEWSDVRNFTTFGVDLLKITQPGSEVPLDYSIRYIEIKGTKWYSVEISEEESMKNATVYKSYDNDSYEFRDLDVNTKYYVRIKAFESKDNFSGYSNTITLQTVTSVNPRSPENNEVDVDPKKVTLQWSSVAGLRTYRVFFTNDPEMVKGTEYISNIDGRTFTIPKTLEQGQSYYWKVQGYKGDKSTAWSEVMSFTTKAAPDGIEDIFGTKSNVNVYPVPAKDNIKIQVTPSENSQAKINLINLVGKTISSKIENFNANEQKTIQIPVSNINSGVYFLKIETRNGSRVQKVIIK
ncbi:MAG: fibronectin type III domain-containing protein [Bacteroidales bacterium]